jgi:hypothetical protein
MKRAGQVFLERRGIPTEGSFSQEKNIKRGILYCSNQILGEIAHFVLQFPSPASHHLHSWFNLVYELFGFGFSLFSNEFEIAHFVQGLKFKTSKVLGRH